MTASVALARGRTAGVIRVLAAAGRYAWAAPASAVGLALSVLGCVFGARARVTHGVVEVAGGLLARLAERTPGLHQFEAITLGHVVLGHTHDLLARHRAHEHVHVRQFERWGVLLFVAYPACSAYQWTRGRRPYWDNPFECEAREGESKAH